jgi:hypothetical protein
MSLIQCHRCECAFEDGTGYDVTITGEVSRTQQVCKSCASFIAAAIDGRPLFSRGLKAKYDTCLEDPIDVGSPPECSEEPGEWPDGSIGLKPPA